MSAKSSGKYHKPSHYEGKGNKEFYVKFAIIASESG